jgi:ATP adenylyltransferase
MEFIRSEKAGGCIFCEFPAEIGEAADRKNLIVHRSAHAFTILNRYPYNSGHLMVVPRAHVAALDALDSEHYRDLQGELLRAQAALRAAYRPEGMNLGMNLGRAGGAGIADHLHWHLVPRWVGDNNFMPVIGDVRVVPEALEQAWSVLRAGFSG